MFRAGLLLLLVAGLSSCVHSSSELSGFLVYGHEARTIQLCGHSEIFWLTTTPQQRRQLASAVQKLSQAPYQKLYIELSGTIGKDVSGEFSREYDGTVHMTKIKRISANIPDSCLGDQPTP